VYKRILLAYDGTAEGRAALREGALLAKHCRAQVFLLSVIVETAGTRTAEGMGAGGGIQHDENYRALLDDSVARLRKLGFDPVAELVRGDPAQEIGAFADKIAADLVVVGHRKKGLFERWWSGPSGAYLVDHIHCSLLVGRTIISDEAFEAEMTSASGG
jgi:nucleotide-binding universal stress UspA family protein